VLAQRIEDGPQRIQKYESGTDRVAASTQFHIGDGRQMAVLPRRRLLLGMWRIISAPAPTAPAHRCELTESAAPVAAWRDILNGRALRSPTAPPQ
jgi:hypothetical protein